MALYILLFLYIISVGIGAYGVIKIIRDEGSATVQDVWYGFWLAVIPVMNIVVAFHAFGFNEDKVVWKKKE